MRVALLCTGALAAYPPAQGCDAPMDGWCSASFSCNQAMEKAGCKKELYARYDVSRGGSQKQWRCYSADALTADHSAFNGDSTCYCSEPTALPQVLSCCKSPEATGCSAPGVEVFPFNSPDVYEYRIPVILNYKDTIMAFAEARLLGGGDAGPKFLGMRRSKDNGATWDTVQSIYRDSSNATNYDGLNLGAAVVVGDKVIVHVVVGSHSLKVAPAFVLVSGDGGDTWDGPNYITKSLVAGGINMFAGGPGSGFVLPSGRVVVTGWYNWCCGQKANSSDTGSAVLLSDDHGATWRVGGKVPKQAAGQPNECQAAALPDGTIVLNMRDAAGGGHRLLATSTDGGETFSAASKIDDLIDPTCQGSTIAVGTTLFTSNAYSRAGRHNGTLSRSADRGQSWQQVSVINAGDFVYSGLVDINDTHVGVIYETYSFGRLGIVYQAVSKRETTVLV